ncbi:chemotaxis protein-glutamate methylesterase [Actinoplanes sp. SE50]|uniref:protein-glutamate methylesterase/protein-glutamine glutaminase n=1 Tax=unclassified Actinoplanes TaxID=2626549 RepID=UPI00023EDF04|nr:MULTISPECIES: chemotaxis response regulator protein-glutamate methylesterase [unclassified Actinoplanes]AEV88811.1 two-component system, chemotaxis family, response regulator CheB [Actinoplanes sp. SE50/110]ATO87217.1 chemotaxis protein-glutamate methylesterase [Actinoplanes sp. SE50]SLM04635.1 chemotaxis response regulator protein-glutamate methylesterase [Actinoplanes sp. SE50/110]
MISVLVVDDSVVVRRLIVDALGEAPGIQVVGTAANGLLAQAKIDQLKPDVVTMDIEMPQMDGIEAVRELRKRHAALPVIMFSTLSAAGATATLEALSAGATDYVTKPSNVGSVKESIEAVREQLVPKIQALGGRRRPPPGAPPRGPAPAAGPRPGIGPVPGRPGLTPPGPARPPAPAAPAGPAGARPPARRGPQGRIDILAIGSSTGGPDALTKVLHGLPADLPVPVVITQHMPPVFTKMFAERLDRSIPLKVVEAGDGMELAPGTVYIAPGDRHLIFNRRGTSTLTQLSNAPQENSCRPAVDVMFRSVAALYGGTAFATVLTGMGQDGRGGAKVLRDAGCEILAQDEASSVVWGMPGAVVGAGLADEVLPLDRIAAALLNRVRVGRSAAVAR